MRRVIVWYKDSNGIVVKAFIFIEKSELRKPREEKVFAIGQTLTKQKKLTSAQLIAFR